MSTVNVMASWYMNKIGLQTSKSSCIRLKVADQRCVQTTGMINQVPVTVNGVTVNLDFHVLDVSSARGGYPIILGRAWLRLVRAVNYGEKEGCGLVQL